MKEELRSYLKYLKKKVERIQIEKILEKELLERKMCSWRREIV
jgi:hypothetical protein